MSKFDLENRELFAMVNRPHGMGGELPCMTMHFVPADRAESVLALDARIQSMKHALPWMLCGAVGVLCFILVTAV